MCRGNLNISNKDKQSNELTVLLKGDKNTVLVRHLSLQAKNSSNLIPHSEIIISQLWSLLLQDQIEK